MAHEMNLKIMEQYFQGYLRLHDHMVGVRLLKTPEDYVASRQRTFKGKAFYCQMVSKAVKGRVMKAALGHNSCDTSARILGLKPYYEEQEDIDGWYDSGLYGSMETAVMQKEAVRPVDGTNSGVEVGALSKLSDLPDIVMVACNPYQAMRLTQGYTYAFGFKKDMGFSGQCGVCFESTALPYTKEAFSVSLLCAGTRFMSKWSDDTMMVAFPFSMAQKILDGLAMTANHVEPDKYKHHIEKWLKRHSLEAMTPLEKKKAYFYRPSA